MQRILAGVLAGVFFSGLAPAGEIADRAARAESLAADGKYVEALETLDQAATSLWNKSPLSFRKVLWVADPPMGFGVYNPRKTNVYKAGDKMIVYCEPIGIDSKWVGGMDGAWQYEFALDLTVKTKDGRQVYSQANIGKHEGVSRVRTRQLMCRVDITLTNIPDGEYTVEVTLRDSASGKHGMFSLPFVIE